jgi:D-glycerate 3-kinase
MNVSQTSLPAFAYSPQQRACCIDPLVRTIRKLQRSCETVIVGIQGGQGTGKTTLAKYLATRLSKKGSRVVSFSIDDFYTTYKARKRLSEKHSDNPFYRLPRGMPGTHRTSALHAALSCLKNGTDVDLPVFDKSLHHGHGDRADRVVTVRGKQDVVLFEGWCIGMPEVTLDELIQACGRQRLSDLAPLPASEHLDAVLFHLDKYQRLWRLIDFLVTLVPDSLALHERWRLAQEKDLIARTGAGMSEEAVRTMVRRFLPFTCLCNDKIVPDLRIRIDKQHAFYDLASPD